MMVGVRFSGALRLLCAMAMLCVGATDHSGPALAASITISGSPFGSDGIVSFPGYGSSVNQNNVIGFGPSGIERPAGLPRGSGWVAQGNTTSGMVVSNLEHYAVDWYFSGAESGYRIEFQAGSIAFAENDENNRSSFGNDDGWRRLGTSFGSGLGLPIPFSLVDEGGRLANGDNNAPGAFVASLMFAYVEPIRFDENGAPMKWRIARSPTDWFAFGYDDAGSRNNDHDDYMGLGRLYATPALTPLPGALPLMGTMLGIGVLARWYRRRRSHRLASLQA